MCKITKKFHKDLTSIFGVGKARRLFVVKALGLSATTTAFRSSTRYKNIFEKAQPIVKRFKIGFILSSTLKKVAEVSASTYGFKFLRTLMCLPCNGQRSRTNARTTRLRRKIIPVKKKLAKKKSTQTVCSLYDAYFTRG